MISPNGFWDILGDKFGRGLKLWQQQFMTNYKGVNIEAVLIVLMCTLLSPWSEESVDLGTVELHSSLCAIWTSPFNS